MKILMIITGLGMGGAEHVVINLADELATLGHEVKLAYLNGEIAVKVSPENPEVELISIGMHGSKDFVKAYIRLRKLVKDFKPDVVHSHMVHANIISRLLRLTIRIPKVISTAHSSNEGGKLRMLAYRLTDKLADISVNVSQSAVEEFINKGAVKPGRMITIANGIDTDKFKFNDSSRIKLRSQLSINNEKVILAVGRLDAAKDYSNLLNAITLLKIERQDFKVFIVGDGPYKDTLYKLTKDLKIDSCVRFLGVRNDVKELMSAADIYVMSSAWEGLPMVILEAMACERLIVATDCGGISEAVGSQGLLVESKNETVLAQALDKALRLSDVERSNIGAAARKRIIDHYSLDANVEAYLNLYNQ
ncbi:glycosyltransferase [Psychrobacter sp. NG254]|uniref:glycosyltransferase n=1 Tax=Psychrobacter sp. NG254 TaxID=2782003 RepID=UPI0018890D57|nr:glycosyltransferase [Psychrobacter sp. NG254]MBF2719722.1 glycosyltransferase [Psychrobacter sp. NG254]